MKIKTIKICNFASYYKVHTINFDDKLNIIGGHNGGGKTSLLKAFKWGLFGARLYNSTHVTKSYAQFLKESLNNSDKTLNAFYVELILEDNYDEYYIKRSVRFESDNFKERVEYKINNKKVTNIALLDKYNPEVIDSVFFDGEEIINVINDDKISNYVHSLVVELFDLKMFKVLNKDLNILQKRNIDEYSDTKYNGTKHNIDLLKKQKKSQEEKITALENKLQDYEQKLVITNNEMASHGILSNSETKNLSIQMEKLKKEQEIITKELKFFYTNDFLVFLQRDKLNKVVENLRETRDKRREQLKDLYDNFDIEVEIDYNLERKFEQKFNIEFDKKHIIQLIKQNTDKDKEIVKIKNLLNESNIGSEYNSLINNYDFIEKEIINLKANIKTEKSVLDIILKDYEKAYSSFEVEEERLLKLLKENNAAVETKKLLNLVNEYIELQTNNVYSEINSKVNEIYGLIKRKKNYITDIKMNQDSILVTANGEVVNLLTISSGEKQTVILALLFTILKVSKTNLPLVLDTFLGRLDAAHSINLLTFITKELDNQVVILATDKEITDNEYKYLKPLKPSEITLDNSNNRTKIMKGFFNYENKNYETSK